MLSVGLSDHVRQATEDPKCEGLRNDEKLPMGTMPDTDRLDPGQAVPETNTEKPSQAMLWGKSKELM